MKWLCVDFVFVIVECCIGVIMVVVMMIVVVCVGIVVFVIGGIGGVYCGVE